MSFLPNSADPKSPAPLARDGGAGDAAQLPEDPIAAWIDLMEVVEELCPQWPERREASGGQFKL